MNYLFIFSVLFPDIVVSMIVRAIFVPAVAAVTVTLTNSHHLLLSSSETKFLDEMLKSNLCTFETILLQSHDNCLSNNGNPFQSNQFHILGCLILTMCRFYS